MATKMKSAAAGNSSEAPQDGPLLDLTDQSVKAMIKAAKKRGFITHNEIIKALPEEEFTSEQIEDVLAQLSEVGVNVIDNEDSPEDEDEAKAKDEGDDTDDDKDDEEEGGKAVAAKGSTAITGQNTPSSAGAHVSA